jgi:group II intron reverse transcriptase/maturase
MQKAEQILQAIRKLGEQRAPLTRVYRTLYSEDLYLAAYSKIYRNQGAMTPGSENDTADGMSLERIRSIIDELRHERFRFKPARRTEIPKKSGKGKRKLGLPNFTDKLVQEVLRMILEAYYEPRFRESSHGFRPQRGCHTALTRIKESFRASAWFIEGDIKGCFDNIDHTALLTILARDIHDGRLLNLIRLGLEAGVMEGWEYHRTYSGTPQGGILSPLLTNIYLNELDTFVEDVLIPRYTKGEKRARNKEYIRICNLIAHAREKGNQERVEQLAREQRKLSSVDTHDPNFRRLRYVRYADDFILSVIGTRAEAETIKQAIGEFLQLHLKLEMSAEKTLITHARTEYARFLNYTISIWQSDDKLTRQNNERATKMRATNGEVRLGVPFGLATEHAQQYMQKGRPVADAAMLAFSDAHIIDNYQNRYRGLAEYYKYATDRYRLNYLKGVMQSALVKTLMQKYKLNVTSVYRKYRGTMEVDGRQYSTLQVVVPTKRGQRTIYWGAVPLKTVKVGTGRLDDGKFVSFAYRSDLVQRLQADQCELCGSREKCEVHHVRKLSDLKRRWAGRAEKPEWVSRMIAMERKTLVLCFKCHRKVHAGEPTPKKSE